MASSSATCLGEARKGLDIFFVPRSTFAQDVLNADPAALQQSLDANYP